MNERISLQREPPGVRKDLQEAAACLLPSWFIGGSGVPDTRPALDFLVGRPSDRRPLLIGFSHEAAGFLGWVLDAVERDGRPSVLYDLDGRPPGPERTDLGLEGYRRSSWLVGLRPAATLLIADVVTYLLALFGLQAVADLPCGARSARLGYPGVGDVARRADDDRGERITGIVAVGEREFVAATRALIRHPERHAWTRRAARAPALESSAA